MGELALIAGKCMIFLPSLMISKLDPTGMIPGKLLPITSMETTINLSRLQLKVGGECCPTWAVRDGSSCGSTPSCTIMTEELDELPYHRSYLTKAKSSKRFKFLNF